MASESHSATERSELLSQQHSSVDEHHASSHKNLGEDVPLYSKPRQRQRWDDLQILPHVNWGDLFFDLFYVAAAYNLAVILKESPSAEGLFYFVACLCVVFLLWFEKLVFDARFAPEDNLFHRSLDVMKILLVATAIQHIRPVESMKNIATNPTTFVFCTSLVLVNVIEIIQYKDVMKHVIGGGEAKHHARGDINRKLCSLVPFLLAAIISLKAYLQGTVLYSFEEELGEVDGGVEEEEEGGSSLPILLCLLGYVAENVKDMLESWVFMPLSGRNFKELRVPLNLEFTLHRIGEWTMLMLGESVLSLLIVEESAGLRYYITFYSGVFSVTMMQYLFFRSQPFSADDHAMRRARIGGYQFSYALQLFSGTLIIIGCSFKLILHHYLDEEAVEHGHPMEEGEPPYPLEEAAQRIANMFSWSLASSFFLLNLMMVSHRGWVANFSRLVMNGGVHWPPTLIFLLDIVLIVVMGTLSLWITTLEYLSAAGALLVTCEVLLRTLGLRFFPVSKAAMERAIAGGGGGGGGSTAMAPRDHRRWPNTTEPQSIPSSSNKK